MKQQWYKVTRNDGRVQYACTYNDKPQYFIWGIGMAIGKFDAKSVSPIDKVPIQLEEGYTGFDCGPRFKAITDTNQRWNGWYKPFIHESEIELFCEFMSQDPDYVTYELKDGIVTIFHKDVGDFPNTVISSTEINGEKFYYFGDEGLCFEWMEKAEFEDESRLFEVLSPDGFPITHEDHYKGIKNAHEALRQWINKYKTQGYYRDGKMRKISLINLWEECSFFELD